MVNHLHPGKVTISDDSVRHDHESISGIILCLCMEVLESREKVLVERIKQYIIELTHHMNNMDSIVPKFDYLLERRHVP